MAKHTVGFLQQNSCPLEMSSERLEYVQELPWLRISGVNVYDNKQ
jgi:hypothetical protein